VQKKGRDKMTDQMKCLLVTYHFQEGTKELLRNFLGFFISYGLELGKQPGDNEFEQLAKKLQSLGSSAKVKSS
jgi:hypothetical protein